MTSAKRREPRQLSPRFEVLSKLGEGGMGVVYEVRDHETGAVLAAKTLDAMSPERLYALKSEFRRLADLTHGNLIQLGELFYDGSECFFTMELVRGEDLQRYVRIGEGSQEDDDTKTSSSLAADTYARAGERILGVSARASQPAATARGPAAFDEARLRRSFAQLAGAVHALHGYGILHRDLKPSNVLVDQQGRLVVLDFGIAEQMSRAANSNDHTVSGTPAFMAPEQALASELGPAADWYAFGVMLFYALTGRLPFLGAGAEQLLAKDQLTAPLPSELIESCPADLDALCTALLARNPADRPTGEQVVAAFANRRSVPRGVGFGQGDEATFVGRTAELTRLHEALGEVGEGAPVGLLIEGAPGLGKTALVEHFLQQLAADEQSLTVLQGRCYEQEFVAYKGLDAVIDMLSRYLKALDQDKLAKLLPIRFSLVAALFPVLHRVPAIAAASPSADVNETKPELRDEAFAQLALLLSAIARDTRLIIFIDDLQWAGDDTLTALRGLIEGAERPALLLLATSRESQRRSAPPERHAVSDQASADRQVPFERLELLPLSHAESSELTSQIFALAEAQPVDVALLERLLHESAGHPLFLRELARYLQRGEKLPRELRLEDVLRERIGSLEPAGRRLLEVVAIAGVPLPTRVFARVAGVGRAATADLVRMLRAAQLVRVSRAAHRQQTLEPYHDRVREAVGHGVAQGTYKLTVAKDPAAIHLALARQLLRARHEDPLTVSTATLANQYNLALSALRAPEDAREAVAANLDAARLAKLSAAYENALHYIDAARAHAACLTAPSIVQATRSIDLRELELTLLMDDQDRAEHVFARLLTDAPGDAALAEAYQTKINGETAMSRHADALASAREGLRKLSFQFPEEGSQWRVLLDVIRLEFALRGHTSESILAMPLATDERTRAQTVLVMASGPAAFFTDTALMSLLALRVTLLTLKRGVSEFSAYGFASYALVLGGAFQKYARAHEFGLLAKRLNERLQNRALDCKLETMYTLFCVPYVRPVEDTWAGIQHAQELGLANGDLAFRTYAAGALAAFAMIAGRPLPEQVAACVQGVRVAEQEGNVDIALMNQLRLRSIRCLDGRNARPLQMDDADSNERDFLQMFEDKPLQAARFMYYQQQTLLGCHFDDTAFALRAAERAEEYTAGQFNMPTLIDLSFYVALAATRQCSSARALDWFKLITLAWRKVDHLRGLARANERNYGSRYLLARAELRRALGRRKAARVDLEAALALAQRHGTHNVTALAFERLAMWHEQSGNLDERRRALEGAVGAYRSWGAHACAARATRLLEQSAG